MQVASSKSECSVATDKDVSRQPSSQQLTSETPGTLPTAGCSKLKQARIFFPPTTGTSCSATASVSQRGKEASDKICAPVKPTSTEEPLQEDMMVEETPVPSAAMDVAEAGGIGTEGNASPSTLGTSRVGSQTSTVRGDHPKPPKVKLPKAQRDALREERERARTEARAKREAEKLLKEQEKKERREKRERELRERQERREQEERARREKREADRRKKEEETRKREERKRKEEDERKKAEMETEQAKEEKLRKKELAKERFLGFFPKLPKGNGSIKDVAKPEFSIFTAFSVKPGMTLAKTPQPFLNDTTNIDVLMELQSPASATYLVEHRVKKISSTTEATVISDAEDEDDVIIVSPSPVQQVAKGKFKLLQFHSNYRPAYYGTWRRRSRIISPRNPFRKDEDLLDYEVDSDDEWEEEEPGESLSHSENEEADSGDDSEEDDSFFVPHGYLSEGEGEQSDGELANAMDITDGSRKQKQLAKAKAWEAEFARRCQPIKPVQIWCKVGCDCSSRNEEFLQQFSAMALVELPISIKSSGETTTNTSHDNVNVNVESTKRCVPEEAMPELIRLVHGSAMGVGKLIKTFRMHWGAKMISSRSNPSNSISSEPVLATPSSHRSNIAQYESASRISKRQLEIKIQSMAIKELQPPSNKPVWYVHEPVLKQYNMDPQAITPLVPLVSPLSKSTSETPKMSPETPCSSGSSAVKRGIKRKTISTPSVKSLFEVLKEKRPVTEAASTQFKNTSPQFCQTSPTFSTLIPPAKKARPNTGGTSSISEVIVIQSDDSLESSNSTKENVSANLANAATSTAVNDNSQPIRLPSPQVHLGALQERTNALGNTCEEQRIDWQKLLLNSNQVHVTAEIH